MSLFRRRNNSVQARPSAVFTHAEMIQALHNAHPYAFKEFTVDPDGKARNLTIEVDRNLTVTITQEQP